MSFRFTGIILFAATIMACGQVKKSRDHTSLPPSEDPKISMIPRDDHALVISSLDADQKLLFLNKDANNGSVNLSWNTNAKSCMLETKTETSSWIKVVPPATEVYVVKVEADTTFTLRCDKDFNSQATKAVDIRVQKNADTTQLCGGLLVANKSSDRVGIYSASKDEIIANVQNGQILQRTITQADANGFQEIYWKATLARVKAAEIEDSCDPKAKLSERLKVENATPFVREDGTICDIEAGSLKVLYAFEQNAEKTWTKVTVLGNPYTKCPTANFEKVTGWVKPDAVSRVLSYEGYPTETSFKIVKLSLPN